MKTVRPIAARILAALFLFVAIARTGPAQTGANTDASVLLERGSALVATKPGEAVKILQEARKLDPARFEIRYQLGLAYHATGDGADAQAELLEAITLSPDSAPAHNHLGIVFFESGNAAAAAEQFQIAARLAPDDPNVHFNQAEALSVAREKTTPPEQAAE